MSTESGEKLAAELADSFDKQPLKPETKLPKKAKQAEPVNPGPDVAYLETSAKSNKNVEGVSRSQLLFSFNLLLEKDDISTGFPRHRKEN